VKHVSGATQADDAEKALIVGNRPPPNIPIDVERKSKAMAIPIGVEQKPLVGGLPNVSAPTNVKKNADPLAALTAPEGKKPNMSKEEKKVLREKEKLEKKAKKIAEKEAKKSGKSGIVLEKRKFPSSAAAANVPPPGINQVAPNASHYYVSPNSAPSVPSTHPPHISPVSPPPPEPCREEDEEDEISEFCSKCGSLNVFPPGVDCVACYECDTPIHAPANAHPKSSVHFDSAEEEDDEITDLCPSCGTLNAFPSEVVPQIACYNCGSAINNPKCHDGAHDPVEEDGEEGELQAFCLKCGSLNIFPPGVFAVACWECESPIYYNS